MSEKTSERAPPHPVQSPSQSALDSKVNTAALSPSERAERELAKMDEEMDAILGNKSNREALMNSPEQALQPPQGRSVTPSVAPPIAASNFNHMVLNCIVPGSGSLLHRNYGVGMLQLGMAVAALPTLFSGRILLAIFLSIVAYVWSVISGIGFLSQPRTNSWK